MNNGEEVCFYKSGNSSFSLSRAQSTASLFQSPLSSLEICYHAVGGVDNSGTLLVGLLTDVVREQSGNIFFQCR